MIRVVLLLLASLSLLACRPATWIVRSVPGCYIASGSVELDRERSYLAALLALEARGYTILHAAVPSQAGAPGQIEAEFVSSYKPDSTRTRWLVDVLADASLRVDTVPPAAAVHKKADGWFSKLQQTIESYGCRDLNWLRWEAQNRGLTPMVGETSAVPAAGGELPLEASPGEGSVSPAPSSAAPPVEQPGVHAQRTARRAQLAQERSEIRLNGSIALAAVRLGSVAGAAGLGTSGILYYTSPCDERASDGPGGSTVIESDCTMRTLGRNFLIGAGAVAAVGVVLLAVGLPRLMGQLRKRRAIDRELRMLQEPTLSFDAGPRRFGLSLRASF